MGYLPPVAAVGCCANTRSGHVRPQQVELKFMAEADAVRRRGSTSVGSCCCLAHIDMGPDQMAGIATRAVIDNEIVKAPVRRGSFVAETANSQTALVC